MHSIDSIAVPFLQGSSPFFHMLQFIDPNPHCLICGQYVTDRCLQLLSQSLYTFLVQTGTIQSSKEVSRDVCTSCKLAVELMEQARKAQEALSVCFKKKWVNTQWSSVVSSLQLQLSVVYPEPQIWVFAWKWLARTYFIFTDKFTGCIQHSLILTPTRQWMNCVNEWSLSNK